MTTKDSNEAGSLLSCLAMVGDKKAQDALYELKVNPRPWRKKLFVDADVYAEEGGWTFDSNNNYIKLNYDKCFAFVDGDKRMYIDYYEMVLKHLSAGGYIIADNTLWDGHVLEQPRSSDTQTIGIKAFNDFIATDSRVEKVILPLRDGLTIIRKKI